MQATARRSRRKRRDDSRREIHREFTRRRYRSIPIVVAGAILALTSVKLRPVWASPPHRPLP
ncbi:MULTISPECIES: hypothetical protein [Burkholderia]|uniref:hypothetical protein n=1 Tax=Burkholderia TaxID=32008 RepID=UPI001E28E5E4|nr:MULTISPECIES: hypothetical protein [unclassified Burkholderia]UEP32931.1 hypothetical protein LMA01_32060 [Burkholderia sp. B21-007]UEP46005.1 hypothetical protein LMA02_34255 [Burkholderia sp. B21-005]